MIRTVLIAMAAGALAFCGTVPASAQWDPNDDTFDPSIKSVVIGDRSWLGDPSPFVLEELRRTGYTYVSATNYEGMAPSVTISLMVPIKLGETKPLGAALFFDRAKAKSMSRLLTKTLESKAKETEPMEIVTTIENATWRLVPTEEEGKRLFVFENKKKDEVDRYRFSANALKKLLGAFEHARNNLKDEK